MLYWDTSALLKLYAPEPDSPYFLDRIAESGEPAYTSEIAQTEMLCGLRRKEWAGDLRTGAAEFLFERFTAHFAAGHLIALPYGADVFSEVRRLFDKLHARPQPVMLRSLDAIHLASALHCGAKHLVATDVRLREAAMRMDLGILPG